MYSDTDKRIGTQPEKDGPKRQAKEGLWVENERTMPWQKKRKTNKIQTTVCKTQHIKLNIEPLKHYQTRISSVLFSTVESVDFSNKPHDNKFIMWILNTDPFQKQLLHYMYRYYAMRAIINLLIFYFIGQCFTLWTYFQIKYVPLNINFRIHVCYK